MFRSLQVVLSLTFFALLFACSNNGEHTPGTTPVGTAIEAFDGTQAEEIVLENGLHVLLISNPKTTTSKVAISVGAGSFNDPAHQIGLAHFVEHMLFFGNAEFPGTSEYMDFLREKGAKYNAYTMATSTTYFAEIANESYPEAVRRMSRAFVSPFFKEDNVAAEKNAIENEFTRNLDARQPNRAYQFFTSKTSVSRKFGTGNLKTLSSATAQDARGFFEKHYTAAGITAVFASSLPLAQLRQLAEKNLSDIPNRGPKTKALKVSLMATRYNHIIKISNKNLTNNLDVSITHGLDDANATAKYIMGYVMGDESEGSLLSVLQKRGWALNQAGALMGGADSKAFTFNIKLTPEGVIHYRDVIALIKGYIEFVKTQPYPAYVVDRINSSSKSNDLQTDYANFDIQQIVQVAGSLHDPETKWREIFKSTPLPDVAEANYRDLFLKTDQSEVYGLLIDNSTDSTLSSVGQAGHVFSDANQLDEIEGTRKFLLDGVYDAAYEILPLNYSALEAATDPSFAIIRENPYIATTFTQLNTPVPTEPVFLDGNNSQIRLNPGAGVTLPKTFFNGVMISPKFNRQDPVALSRLVLLKDWLQLVANQKTYVLTEAEFEMTFGVNIQLGAIQMGLNGWSDNFAKAFDLYIKSFELSDDEVAFQRLKAVATTAITQRSQSADALMSDASLNHFHPGWPTREERIEAISRVTLQEIKELYQTYTGEMYIQGVLSGNVTEEMGQLLLKTLAEKWQQTVVISQEEIKKVKDIQFSPLAVQSVVEVRIDGNANSYVNRLYDFGSTSKDMVMAYIVGEGLEALFYNDLRTQQQVAYSLGAGFAREFGHYGIRYYVESGTNAAADVNGRVLEFINKWVTETLPHMTQEEIDVAVESVKKIANAPATSHTAVVTDYIFSFLKLDNVDTDFKVTKADLEAYVKDRFLENPAGVFVQVKSVRDPVERVYLNPAR